MSYSITNLCIKDAIYLLRISVLSLTLTLQHNIIKMVKTFFIISVIVIAFILISEKPVLAHRDPEPGSLSEIMRSIIDIIRNFLDNILTGKTVDKNRRPGHGKWFNF